jgi:hypothetical protein
MVIEMVERRSDDRIDIHVRPQPERPRAFELMRLRWTLPTWRTERVDAASAQQAMDRLLFGEVPAVIFAEQRRRAVRALCMPDPSVGDHPLMLLLTDQPDASRNGSYRVSDHGELLPYTIAEEPRPWWRGAVAAAGGAA